MVVICQKVGWSVEEFKEKAVEENRLFVLRKREIDEDGDERESVQLLPGPEGCGCHLSDWMDSRRQMAHQMAMVSEFRTRITRRTS